MMSHKKVQQRSETAASHRRHRLRINKLSFLVINFLYHFYNFNFISLERKSKLCVQNVF